MEISIPVLKFRKTKKPKRMTYAFKYIYICHNIKFYQNNFKNNKVLV